MSEYHGFTTGERVRKEYMERFGTVIKVSPKLHIITVRYDDGVVTRYNLWGYKTGYNYKFQGEHIVHVVI